MSDGPIKPDDIPRELIEWHLRSHVADSWAEALAERLNKAIELGVVSPPCHYIERDGNRLRTGGKLRIWPGKPEPGFAQYRHRHWKGEE